MSKFGWFVVGIGLGALTIVQLRDNPKAQEAVDEIRSAAKEFSASLADGYQERQAEIDKASKTKK